jgi:type 1 glutamine amidotransferase
MITLNYNGICKNDKKLIRILILSGKNNHEWQKTTPVILKTYQDAGLFIAEVSERPDTLKYKDFRRYDVIFSNWNSWPDNAFRMPPVWENDFVRYINEGGGMIFLHAGASSFYDWDDYHRIGIGRWGRETSHGKLIAGHISVFDKRHPVTAFLKDFEIVDEIWEKTDLFPVAKVLAKISAVSDKDGHTIIEPAVLVNTIGKGRSFYTSLGHNEKTLMNTGLQNLLLRAAQWTAGRKVTIR